MVTLVLFDCVSNLRRNEQLNQSDIEYAGGKKEFFNQWMINGRKEKKTKFRFAVNNGRDAHAWLEYDKSFSMIFLAHVQIKKKRNHMTSNSRFSTIEMHSFSDTF